MKSQITGIFVPILFLVFVAEDMAGQSRDTITRATKSLTLTQKNDQRPVQVEWPMRPGPATKIQHDEQRALREYLRDQEDRRIQEQQWQYEQQQRGSD